MSTVRTCTTPEEGWALFSHFIGNSLLVAQLLMEEAKEEDDVSRRRQEKAIDDNWSKLVGNLYVIVRRMETNYHYADAIKMRLILDMVVELSITEPEVCAAICRELHRARHSNVRL